MSCGKKTPSKYPFLLVYVSCKNNITNKSRRLHETCNIECSSIGDDGPSSREKELIQRLEEATEEIEALLGENEKLMMLSNELRFKLQTKAGQSSLPSNLQQTPSMECHDETREYEQAMLEAILTDQSTRSCDSKGHDDYLEVACVGRSAPLSNADESRPSKTAYVREILPLCVAFAYELSNSRVLVAKGSRPRTASDRTTASQRQSFKRLLGRKKKELSVEKSKIRNWNVKDPTSNPYM